MGKDGKQIQAFSKILLEDGGKVKERASSGEQILVRNRAVVMLSAKMIEKTVKTRTQPPKRVLEGPITSSQILKQSP
jgi:hypothetical protein